MQNRRDTIASILLILTGIGVIIGSIRLQVGTLSTPLPGFFPFLVGFTIVALSIILLIQGKLGVGKKYPSFRNWQRPLVMLAGLGIYTGVLVPVGYILSTIFLVVLTLRVIGLSSWKTISMTSLILPVVVYFFFTRLMDVELPGGILRFLG